MKRKVLISIYFAFFFSTFLNAQDSLWLENKSENGVRLKQADVLSDFKRYTLNYKLLQTKLTSATLRKQSASPAKVIIQFPNASGQLISYKILEAPIMHTLIA